MIKKLTNKDLAAAIITVVLINIICALALLMFYQPIQKAEAIYLSVGLFMAVMLALSLIFELKAELQERAKNV